MTELEAATAMIAQTGADTLYRQLCAGLMTPDEYHAAVALVAPPVETGPRCLYCTESAVVGQTCAKHCDRSAVIAAARAARPTVNLALYATRAKLTAAVVAALERTGRDGPARRFAERAARATNMNALAMIAREYVKLEARMT